MSIFIEVLIIFILIYLVNELLSFTNINKTVDKFVLSKSAKVQEYLKLLLSAFSTNLDFSNSKFSKDRKIYRQSFLMSTVNIFSILNLELLFLIIFLNTSYVVVWNAFIVYNFFIFIWIGKKVIDIALEKESTVIVNENMINFSRINKTKGLEIDYDKKYYLNKKNVLFSLIINLIVGFIVYFVFSQNMLLALLVFLAAVAIELMIYLLFIIYKTDSIGELELYGAITEVFKYIINHIVLLMFGFVILKTSYILYNVFNPLDINILIVLALILIVSVIVLVASNYLFFFVMILPLILVLLPNDTVISSFLLSYGIYIFYIKNIEYKQSSKEVFKEIILVLIGGFLGFITLYNVNMFIAILAVVLYLIVVYFIPLERSKRVVKN